MFPAPPRPLPKFFWKSERGRVRKRIHEKVDDNDDTDLVVMGGWEFSATGLRIVFRSGS